jgi:HAD superfamily hydrolase (TIGR01509 family)
MCDWLKGTPSAEIRATISEFLKSNPTYFANSSERKLITSFAKMVFNPEQFIKTLTLHDQALKLARYCKKQGHTLVVLSNMDAETMALLKQKFPQFFNLCDDIIASGDIGMIKPDPALFAHVINRGHNARACILIDDRPENRQAAEQLEFDTIFLEKKSGLTKEIDFQAIARYIDMRAAQLAPIIA